MRLTIRASIVTAAKEALNLLFYYPAGIKNPDKWLEENKGQKDAEARFEKRKELNEMWKTKVPSNPITGDGPLVKPGYGDDSPFILVQMEKDGSVGWMVPIEKHDAKSVTLLNGQVVELVKGKIKTTKEADKTWAEVADEIKGKRKEEKGKKKKVDYEENAEG